ncbi:MAG: hypothetical protein D3926_16545 [Desulfobacteraceae bacterium]|nr:MAG: hypothetical protein D3926_16545 [Desulfobacteraceae bacterium]
MQIGLSGLQCIGHLMALQDKSSAAVHPSKANCFIWEKFWKILVDYINYLVVKPALRYGINL